MSNNKPISDEELWGVPLEELPDQDEDPGRNIFDEQQEIHDDDRNFFDEAQED